MSEPAPELDPPQNSEPISGAVQPNGMPTGRPFEKGKSGNPGGRPKGLARKVRETLGDDDGATLAQIWTGIATGYMLRVHPETQEREWEKVDVANVLSASKLLAERGWGKPPAYAPIDEEDPLGMTIAAEAEIAASFDQRLDEVAERRALREQAAEPPPA